MHHFRILSTFLFACVATTQQPGAPKNEQELDRQVAQLLVTFARTAETSKLPSRARMAYEQILDHYDIENAAARAGLGWKKVKGEWQQGPVDKLPADAATTPQRNAVTTAWVTTRKRAAALHRELGIALFATEERTRGVTQFERALWFDPDDVKSHEALGHVAFEGFYGTEEQVACAQRRRAILAKAQEVTAMEPTIEALTPNFMPGELKPAGIEFHGARGKHVTFWAADPRLAVLHAVWAERAVAMLDFLWPAERKSRLDYFPIQVRWVVVVRDEAERDRLLEACPVTTGGSTLSAAKTYGGCAFKAAAGQAEWIMHTPGSEDDSAVGLIAKRCNPAFESGCSEGLVHTLTYLLCGTVKARYFIPATRAAGGKDELDRDPTAWLKHIRQLAETEADAPLVHMVRERMERFREPVRAKAWTFVMFLLARHPDTWPALMRSVGADNQTEEEVATAFRTALQREWAEVDAEWRSWVRVGSRYGMASGLPQ